MYIVAVNTRDAMESAIKIYNTKDRIKSGGSVGDVDVESITPVSINIHLAKDLEYFSNPTKHPPRE